ncbi:hypothetical protein B0H13DRAFT_1882182 [Mycena leptocephala]|nr:hypothetical protein B0H13DRAFT_1882182 [Mycena leptocephala]
MSSHRHLGKILLERFTGKHHNISGVQSLRAKWYFKMDTVTTANTIFLPSMFDILRGVPHVPGGKLRAWKYGSELVSKYSAGLFWILPEFATRHENNYFELGCKFDFLRTSLHYLIICMMSGEGYIV